MSCGGGLRRARGVLWLGRRERPQGPRCIPRNVRVTILQAAHRAKRRTRQTLRVRSNTIQVHLSGINKKRDHGPIMVQGWRPAKPDAGLVIKSGFYGVDKATGDRKP